MGNTLNAVDMTSLGAQCGTYGWVIKNFLKEGKWNPRFCRVSQNIRNIFCQFHIGWVRRELPQMFWHQNKKPLPTLEAIELAKVGAFAFRGMTDKAIVVDDFLDFIERSLEVMMRLEERSDEVDREDVERLAAYMKILREVAHSRARDLLAV